MNGYLLGWVVTFVVFVGLAVVFVLAAWSMPRATERYTAEMFMDAERPAELVAGRGLEV
jgi:hypothetical protein